MPISLTPKQARQMGLENSPEKAARKPQDRRKPSRADIPRAGRATHPAVERGASLSAGLQGSTGGTPG